MLGRPLMYEPPSEAESGREERGGASLEHAIRSGPDARPPYARLDRMTTRLGPEAEAPDVPAGGVSTPPTQKAGIQGRESELTLIAELLDEVASGSGGVLVVEGPSGIGKSR